MDLAKHLADLVRASSITGRERAVANVLLQEWAPLVDEAKLDRLGSYIGLKRGEGSAAELRSLPYPGPETSPGRPGARHSGPPKIMAAAHIDSIGGMVTAIEPGGFLRFTTVGGVDRRLLMAQEVEVHGKRLIPGLVGSKPPHVTTPEERNKQMPVEDLYIDTGLTEAEVRDLVALGDPVLPRYEFREMKNGRYSSRYMDNRASVAALRVALEELKHLRHTADFYAVGTVGEEFGGLPGAVTTTFAIKPDIGIAVDVTFAKHPNSEADSFPLGEGPTIGVGPNCSPKLAKVMRKVAEDLGIHYSLEVMPGSSGTDAWGMQIVRGGVATGVLSIPLRYMHTPVETVDMADIKAAGRLLAHLVARVDAALVEDMTCY
ncbi:MAG TPA: M20/M25/M40 family metallo-hydrolase [Symbiobacteriaceae bacterium]|nr:M20/M25/M40 family metallo-hydrolase [Symbiobacteriaceae bacterium]